VNLPRPWSLTRSSTSTPAGTSATARGRSPGPALIEAAARIILAERLEEYG
jgi:hypothetical protein